MHFVRTPFYVHIMPPPLETHALLLVYISGVCEVLGGIGVLLPQTRKAAGIGLLALLIAVFPANVYMAMRPELFRDVGPPVAFIIRLPIQFVVAAWVWWTCF
ncbi:MAG: DoxX family protein [Candidatus Eremiobacteraeota bacterium]|nr:DoxX family protein [Candidatus Eremiobacteraeota bacterium]